MKSMIRLVITGNPGVGKHTSAEFIAQKIQGIKIIDINKFAIDKNAILGRDRKYGIDVDVKKLSKLIDYELRTTTRDFAIIGHLAPYVLKRSRIDFVVVLRRSPYELMKTLEQRKYSLEKIRENVASEILGVSLYDALKTFGKDKIVELDTTGKTPEYIAGKIMLVIQRGGSGKIGIVDWLSLVYKKGDLHNFLEY
ncbi:MAG: adenylate kinase family protein [Nitrososphaeraceae archaeon]